jgi:hypothetical protein
MPTDWADKVRDAITDLELKTDRECLRIVLEPCDPHRERKTNHAAPSRAKSH